jgi:hypothetical protein
MAYRRKIRRKEIEKEIARFQIGATGREKVSSTQRDIWRQRVFRGEYHLSFWSQTIVLESPSVGYAPLESQIKRWAKESQIEGWFPHTVGEYLGFKVIGWADKRSTENRGQTRYAWSKLQRLCMSSHHDVDANQSTELAAADAGDKTKKVQRTGELRLDLLPHRRKNKPPLFFLMSIDFVRSTSSEFCLENGNNPLSTAS